MLHPSYVGSVPAFLLGVFSLRGFFWPIPRYGRASSLPAVPESILFMMRMWGASGRLDSGSCSRWKEPCEPSCSLPPPTPCRGFWRLLTVLSLLIELSAAQAPAPSHPPPAAKSDSQLNVNWLYGAYVDKDAPLIPLTGHQRFKLFVRQSFTTPGIYVKTAFFSLGDQINNSPPEWGTGFGGYARRVGSRQGQFVIQNSLSALGNGLLGYEPRYNRCRCAGFWNRTGHAVARNFVTYDRTEKALRPQIALYGVAFGAGVVSGTWKPSDRDLLAEGYRGAITQVAFGMAANWIGEFAPDIKRVLRGKKQKPKGQ